MKIDTTTKEGLENLLLSWGAGKIKHDEFMSLLKNTDLLSIDEKEQAHTKKAMRVIVSSFCNLRKSWFIHSNYEYAIGFLKTSEEEYEENKASFIDKCFEGT